MPNRTVDPALSPQDQAKHLIDTNNGPTDTDEPAVLAAEFGAPDPNVVPNLTEIKLERERIALRKELEAEAAAVAKGRTK